MENAFLVSKPEVNKLQFMPIFINKVLLELSHTHLYIVWYCFYATVADLSSGGRDHMAYKVLFTLWSFIEKVC